MSTPTNSFWKWFALLLVVLNFTLLIFLTAKPFQRNNKGFERQGPPPEHGGGPANFIIEKLHFNADQIASFNKLKQAHRDSIEALQMQGRKLRTDFFEGLRSDSSSSPELLAKEIANNQLRIEMATYKHFEDVKKICTPDQKEIFNSIIQEVLQRMAPRPMEPRHPDGPPPPRERP